jgi:hypothetical protein
VKTDAGSSASAAAYSLAWVDAAREDLQRGAEEARRAHDGEAGHEVSAGEVATAPPAMPVEAILVLSTEGSRVADATLVAASPTTSEILLFLLDSPTIDRGPRVAYAEEVGPSRRSEEPVLERTVPLPSDEASSGVILVRRDPFNGEAHAFHGWMRTVIHCSSSTMWRSKRCGPSSESWLG